MDAIILAGGLGTRLRKVVPDLPKPLAPIGGRPFLDILLAQLGSFEEISSVVLSVGYQAEKIITAYSERKNVAFSVENAPLGTGGGLREALEQCQSEEVLVLNGDSYLDFSLAKLLKKYKNGSADLMIACRRVEDCSRYGHIQFDQESHRIWAFEEKTEQACPGWINAGVYLMKRNLLLDYSRGTPLSLEKDILPKLLEKQVFGYLSSGLFIDIGTEETYLQAEKMLIGVGRDGK